MTKYTTASTIYGANGTSVQKFRYPTKTITKNTELEEFSILKLYNIQYEINLSAFESYFVLAPELNVEPDGEITRKQLHIWLFWKL